ncbi:hypothetical protein RPQ02_40730 [Streptomyces sp. AM2-3-1]|uniref:hypothetical protein n=1 Tax=Streptomyces sp. AM2-3-1 TaxID=3075824 RepID=UPI0028C4BDB7|nr:hypothetical protein [Streptomyces sp. AM2-3-1]WNO62320.1 hypothetical protein RPQ02_00045 [Streptomyces sp. AM2-3-1]WNO69626.1 hypothetical protein RPQ02_40730 [Streptomyces sp. AM2-3-1]
MSNVPHVLMYAGEQADRPVAEHREPWSAHLHGSEGDYVATIFDGSRAPLDAADAALCAREVTAWLARYLGGFPPHRRAAVPRTIPRPGAVVAARHRDHRPAPW